MSTIKAVREKVWRAAAVRERQRTCSSVEESERTVGLEEVG